ncbi:hypothetical protein ACE10Z_28755 [Bradyrhizobium sp. Pha-3]|uniref:hypothetical protein n=1 Tax=Bradyrhizobium sp. Pha-3 TaxID=208375 RepID=UPI0035D3E2C9
MLPLTPATHAGAFSAEEFPRHGVSTSSSEHRCAGGGIALPTKLYLKSAGCTGAPFCADAVFRDTTFLQMQVFDTRFAGKGTALRPRIEQTLRHCWRAWMRGVVSAAPPQQLARPHRSRTVAIDPLLDVMVVSAGGKWARDRGLP